MKYFDGQYYQSTWEWKKARKVRFYELINQGMTLDEVYYQYGIHQGIGQKWLIELDKQLKKEQSIDFSNAMYNIEMNEPRLNPRYLSFEQRVSIADMLLRDCS